MQTGITLGINNLMTRHGNWLKRRRVGLVSHQAAVDAQGVSSLEHLAKECGRKLTALFGPEHGFNAGAGAGVIVNRTRHSELGIPVFSLYGKHRSPTPAMLKGIDLLVIDFQDLGARMYTYLTTMLNVMTAAAQHGIPVVVADRPIPLPRIVDGPMLDPAYRGFVAAAPLPMSYGMTPAETALWLRKKLALDLDLRIAGMRGYRRDAVRGSGWPEWLPPSPAIRTWESAQCYVATVFTEGLRNIDCGRGGNLAFRVFGAPWMKSLPVIAQLRRLKLAGVSFHAYAYETSHEKMRGKQLDGVRITVTDPHAFRPALVSAAIIMTLQKIYGARKIWDHPDNSLEGFDRRYGTGSVRDRIRAGTRLPAIAGAWSRENAAFMQSREDCLLYPAG